MTTISRVRPRRAALVATLTVAAFGLAAPPAQSAVHPMDAASTGASIDLRGGNATASLVCGNVADAQSYADANNLTIQQNDCHPEATGGDIELSDVQITIKADAVHASRDNESLAELAASGGNATAQATCVGKGAKPRDGGAVRNHCWSRAKGGRLELDNVTLVNHRAGRETRRLIRSLFMRGTEGKVGSNCSRQDRAGHDSRDGCVARGIGGSVDLRSVDVKRHDGSVSTDVRVSVRGGDADASVYCFNFVRPSTQVRQGNTCSAVSQGGNATLRNVRIDVYAS
jgi:hypothetical protein